MRVSNVTNNNQTDLISIARDITQPTSVKIADGPATPQLRPNGAYNEYGASAAISADGKTLVVGSEIPSSYGGVFVYEGSGESWTFKGRLKISGATTTTNGLHVYISEDGSVIVCSGRESSGTTTPKTFIYVRSGSNWTGDVANPTATLTGSHYIGTETWQADCDISKDGNTVVVGAGWDNYSNDSDRGSVAVYVKPSGGWATTSTATRVLYASDGVSPDRFAWTVCISGDGNTIVAGADQDDVGSNTNQGSAYVFIKGGAWSTATQTEAAKLTQSDGVASDEFSRFSLDISDDGDTIVAGTSVHNSSQGAAYVFMKGGSGWANMTQNCKITASDGAAADAFGTGVSISGDASKIFIIASQDDDDGAESGSFYVYDRPSGGWSASSTLTTHASKSTLADAQASDYIGNRGLNSATDTTGSVFVTCSTNRSSTLTSQGAAFIFVLKEPALEFTTSLSDITATNLTLSSTGAMTIPVGTTAQRPSAAATGMLRFNTTLNKTEIRTPTGWGEITHHEPLYSFTTHTFTHAGAGNPPDTGPTLTQCRNTYSVTWDTDTSLFNITTQGIQQWTVPATGTYTIVCKGASGGAYGNSTGYEGFPGGGATMTATFNLTKNTILNIVVGQRPSSSTSSSYSGSPGGGASWVYTGSIGGSSGLLMVAGGGGGTGHGSSSTTGGNGKGGSSTTNSSEGSANTSIGSGSNARTGHGSTGNKGVGHGGRGTIYPGNGGGGGGTGWLSAGNDDETGTWSGYIGYGGQRFVGGQSRTNVSFVWDWRGGFGGGGGSGGGHAAGGGGGGYTGGGAGDGFNGSIGAWGGGGGGGSYIRADGTNTIKIAGTDAIDQNAVHHGYVTITKI